MMPQRKILKIAGADAEKLLQDLVTNDVGKLAQGPVYAALLTPQGKFIADFILLRDDDGDILMDLHASVADAVAKRLAMYKLRADVSIHETDLGVQRGTGSPPAGAVADPRHPALGWRLYSQAPEGDDGTDWASLRVEHCIPETGTELTPDTFILEAGFERLNGVDFKKGCYVGQEVTARMKHKTELRKGLCTVSVVSGSAETGTPITVEGRPAGTLFTQSGGRAIAYLRFDRASGNMQAGAATLSAD